MRKTLLIRFILAILLLSAALSVSDIFDRLPASPGEIINEMYDGYSGILKLWICEGWTPGAGSLSRWLNSASERFEKTHDGVYVQISYVSPQTLAAFNYAPENPPDILLFSSGMLNDKSDLIPIEAPETILPGLQTNLDGLCVPVAMGGWAWAVNAQLTGTISGAKIAFPNDEQYAHPSVALTAMLTGNCEDTPSESGSSSRYGMDFGLPSPTLPPNETKTQNRKRREIIPGSESIQSDDAYRLFTLSEADALLVSQREISRLESLSQSGRAPDYRIITTGEAYTDQVTYASACGLSKNHAEEKQALSKEFILFLLSDDMQSRLSSAKALRVTKGGALYSSSSAFFELERFYTENRICTPGAFPQSTPAIPKEEIDSLLEGSGSAQDFFYRLFPQQSLSQSFRF
ncbi:MAG: hypothetical protein IJC48_09405 [Clostridia bacterium]|nr:hypothetical protein [Clostridia bacterium]MBQ4156736.1 hypothetical protein [Clostridia bacterium]